MRRWRPAGVTPPRRNGWRVPRKVKKQINPQPKQFAGEWREIVGYVQAVIEERTTPNDDTTAERLARGITMSVLSRLGYTQSQARGRQPLDGSAAGGDQS